MALLFTSPFCTICERLTETEGHPSCEAFPLGISEAIYPWGCARRIPFLFKPKPGMEDIARLWGLAKRQREDGHGRIPENAL